MKKWLVFFYSFLGILVIASILMYLILNYNAHKKKQEKYEQAQEKQDIELKANQTIRVKMSKTGEIVAMDINDYLRGVIPAEMPPSYNMEALKAQAVVARTYTYRKIQDRAEGPDADICDNFNHCQAFYTKDKLFEIWRGRGFSEDTIKEYWDKVAQAVNETQGVVITYKGEYIKAYFHASSPEKTEDVSQIWGGQRIDYLVSVESKEFEDYQWRNSTVELSYGDFEQKVVQNVNSRYRINNRGDSPVICINSYTISGRIKDVKIGNDIVSAEKMRTIFGLRSTNFVLKCENNKVIFNVIGYGHGIGMSQVGANYYASQNMSYKDIIKHYYTGVDVIKIN
ncbi:MAG: stage II sporulation protein D [Clostridia bacterium]|nr:stage II sporulation protein D [Clostridia bacterium]